MVVGVFDGFFEQCTICTQLGILIGKAKMGAWPNKAIRLAIGNRQSPNAPPLVVMVGRVLRNAPRLPTGAHKPSQRVAGNPGPVHRLRIQMAAGRSTEFVPANHCATLAACCGERAPPPCKIPTNHAHSRHIVPNPAPLHPSDARRSGDRPLPGRLQYYMRCLATNRSRRRNGIRIVCRSPPEYLSLFVPIPSSRWGMLCSRGSPISRWRIRAFLFCNLRNLLRRLQALDDGGPFRTAPITLHFRV